MKLLAACLLSWLALVLGAIDDRDGFRDYTPCIPHEPLPKDPEAVRETVWPPPQNPFLSHTPWWAQQHGNSYCTNSVESTDAPCWLPPDDPTRVRIQYCCLDALAVFTYVFNYTEHDGMQVMWMLSALKVAKVKMDDFSVLACHNRVLNIPCVFHDICRDVEDTSERLCFRPETDVVDHTQLGNQIADSGAYSLLSNENILYATGGQYDICRYYDNGRPRARIKYQCTDISSIDGGQNVTKHGSIQGLTMLYWGDIAAVTGGKGSCDPNVSGPCQAAVLILDKNLSQVKHITPLNQDDCNESQVVKGLSNDAEGRIFTVTTEKMYAVDGRTGDILWSSFYPNAGPNEVYCGIKLGRGAGSTPSSMNCGQDKLILTTGGDFPFSLVAFHREKQKDPKLQMADHKKVDYCWGTMPNTDFQSISIVDCDVVVVNNALKVNLTNEEGDCRAPAELVAISGDPYIGTRGAAGYTWNNGKWSPTWCSEIRSPNAIPGQCKDGEGNTFSYYITTHDGIWSVDVLNATGHGAGSFPLGRREEWNGFYAAAMPMDNAFYYGTVLGVVKLSTKPLTTSSERSSSKFKPDFGRETQF